MLSSFFPGITWSNFIEDLFGRHRHTIICLALLIPELKNKDASVIYLIYTKQSNEVAQK